MSFPTNTSPYGSKGLQLPASPQQSQMQNQGGGQNQGGAWWQSLFGKPEQNYRQSNLGQEQQGLYSQLLSAGQQPGAGGAFGQSADYYRDLLDPNSQTANAMFAPEQRRFNEQIIPDLAEQFAAGGYGGTSGSGFRNAAVGAGADLSERLGAIRAQLRQRGAEGLQQIGQQGLNTGFGENIHRPETYGLVGNLAETAATGLGQAGGTYFGNKWSNPGKKE